MGFLLVWTLSLCLSACLYRWLCEARLDPEGHRARTETEQIRHHQEIEDQEYMEEVLRLE
jgi:hypothetical protein